MIDLIKLTDLFIGDKGNSHSMEDLPENEMFFTCLEEMMIMPDKVLPEFTEHNLSRNGYLQDEFMKNPEMQVLYKDSMILNEMNPEDQKMLEESAKELLENNPLLDFMNLGHTDLNNDEKSIDMTGFNAVKLEGSEDQYMIGIYQGSASELFLITINDIDDTANDMLSNVLNESLNNKGYIIFDDIDSISEAGGINYILNKVFLHNKENLTKGGFQNGITDPDIDYKNPQSSMDIEFIYKDKEEILSYMKNIFSGSVNEKQMDLSRALYNTESKSPDLHQEYILSDTEEMDNIKAKNLINKEEISEIPLKNIPEEKLNMETENILKDHDNIMMNSKEDADLINKEKISEIPLKNIPEDKLNMETENILKDHDNIMMNSKEDTDLINKEEISEIPLKNIPKEKLNMETDNIMMNSKEDADLINKEKISEIPLKNIPEEKLTIETENILKDHDNIMMNSKEDTDLINTGKNPAFPQNNIQEDSQIKEERAIIDSHKSLGKDLNLIDKSSNILDSPEIIEKIIKDETVLSENNQLLSKNKLKENGPESVLDQIKTSIPSKSDTQPGVSPSRLPEVQEHFREPLKAVRKNTLIAEKIIEKFSEKYNNSAKDRDQNRLPLFNTTFNERNAPEINTLERRPVDSMEHILKNQTNNLIVKDNSIVYNRENIILNIKNSYNINISESIYVDLEPPSLGKLTIELFEIKGNMNIYLKCESNKAYEVLRNDIENIRYSLREQNIEVNKIIIIQPQELPQNTVRTIIPRPGQQFDDESEKDPKREQDHSNSDKDREERKKNKNKEEE